MHSGSRKVPPAASLLISVMTLLIFLGFLWFVMPVVSGAIAGNGTVSVTSGLAAGQVGEPAPDFTLRTLDGKKVSLRDFRGNTVLINFWATWCPPCRVEMPAIQAVYEEKKGQGFVVLAVNLQEESAVAARFAEEFRLTFPILLDERGQVAALYQLRGLPTSYFVDGAGVVRALRVGDMNRSFIEARLKDLSGG